MPGQIGPVGKAEIVTEGMGAGVTEMIIELEVAVAGTAQLALEVIITLTTSPLFRDVVLKVAPVPVLDPFTCH